MIGKRKAESQADPENVVEETIRSIFTQSVEAHAYIDLADQVSTTQLFNLPETVLLSILENWLNLEDIARFDSAVCNGRDRTLLMSLLHRLTYKHRVNLRCKETIYRWLCQRKISLEQISIVGGSDGTHDRFPLKWSEVKRLSMKPSSANYMSVLEQCINIEELYYSSHYRLNEAEGESLRAGIHQYFATRSHGSGCKLKKLTLIDYGFQSSRFCLDEFVSMVATNLPELESLTLPLNRCSTDTLSALFTNCTQLKSLHISVSPVFTHHMEITMKPNANLQNLSLPERFDSINLMQLMTRNFPNVKKLSVSFDNSSTEALSTFFASFTKLETVRIFSTIHNNGLSYIPLVVDFKYNINLRVLYIDDSGIYCDNNIAVAIGRCFPNLEELHLLVEGCNNEGILAIAEGCLNLKSFQVCGYPEKNVSNILDESFAKLFQNCTGLERLVLSGRQALTNRTLLNITRFCWKLKCLHLKGDGIPCRFITSDQVTLLEPIFCCSDLKELDFACSDINDNMLLYFLLSCPNVEILSLYMCEDISDVSVHYIATYCKNLSTLRLISLHINHNSTYVDEIYNNNPKLKKIKFNYL